MYHYYSNIYIVVNKIYKLKPKLKPSKKEAKINDLESI